MKPRAMARSVGAQKNAARHRMTKQEYEMIVTYLENPDNFAAINGCGKKTKITGKTLTNVTAYGHMAITLCAQGFVKCSGVIMGEESRALCQYVQDRKNILPRHRVGPDRGGDRCGMLGGFFFEIAMPDVTDGDAFYQTFRAGEDCGPEMGNQTGRSAVDVETNAVRTPQQNRVPQQSRGDASVQSVDDVRSSGKTVRSKDRPPPPERKTSIISAYEEQVKEKLVLKKEAQYQKASFRDAILEDRR
ncbi:hypothetical protein R1sor_008222 [Riccia sorocarpa]|uniref:Uncharacterized protein n=1 Tax=Riccia sorocarpa TaxID=122646 RepID=A0ABD3HWX2_9MARC